MSQLPPMTTVIRGIHQAWRDEFNPITTISKSSLLTPSGKYPTIKPRSSHLALSRSESVLSGCCMSPAIVRVLKCISRTARYRQWVDINRREATVMRRNCNDKAARVARSSSEVVQRQGSPYHHPSGERHNFPPRNSRYPCT